MFKSKFLAPMTLICAIALATSAFAADDDVFLDEGNGDFDSMPAAPVAEKEMPPPNPEQSPDQMDAAPTIVDDSSFPTADEPVADVAKPVKAKKQKAAKSTVYPKAPKAAKVAKASKPSKAHKSGGSFVTTKESCPMMRSPASTAETMLTVKPAKKIWVEAAGDGWVKGFNKAGEPGYISSDCVE